uniref:Uncharacterized protein n=1 Tax=Daphnia galeata TaxID=27404 RepID=A0A8J2WPL4_9CRUS|nr:unnamed protein product [Daphnia galeata]
MSTVSFHVLNAYIRKKADERKDKHGKTVVHKDLLVRTTASFSRLASVYPLQVERRQTGMRQKSD